MCNYLFIDDGNFLFTICVPSVEWKGSFMTLIYSSMCSVYVAIVVHVFPYEYAIKFINAWNALSQKSFIWIYWNLITYVQGFAALFSHRGFVSFSPYFFSFSSFHC